MSATVCTCIGAFESRDGRVTWVVAVLDDECAQLPHRAGVAS